MDFTRVYDFDLNCGIAGCCIMQSNQAYFKFAEGTVARVKLQLVKINDDGITRDICLKQFVKDENPGTCAAHTVLINWTNADINTWLLFDSTYHIPSFGLPQALDFKTYMRKLAQFYLETPDFVRISWKLNDGTRPINMWMGKYGETSIEWSEIME
jgi:hypothetical protein